jgi:hypothetical protein
VVLPFASGWDIARDLDRHLCQSHSRNPLNGCDPEKTVLVDSVSRDSKYKTVQSGSGSTSSYVNRVLNIYSCRIIAKQYW